MRRSGVPYHPIYSNLICFNTLQTKLGLRVRHIFSLELLSHEFKDGICSIATTVGHVGFQQIEYFKLELHYSIQ